MSRNRVLVLLALAMALGAAARPATAKNRVLLNVSYDPTRELYQEFNTAFIADWKAKTAETIEINMSHGGAGKQARAVMDGLEADVVTLALAYDIDVIARTGLIPKNWQSRLPDNSSPYTSTIVFLVRAGNPKNIRDWEDLGRAGVQVITPNPKTSGGARWNYLAAWGYGMTTYGGDESRTRDLVGRIFKNVPILDTGARGSTITFAERGIGDVLIAWENEALFVVDQMKPGEFEVVVPSITILAEPPVTVVDQVVDRHGTRDAATAYLEYLYTPVGQEIAAKHYYRPRLAEVAEKHRDVFPEAKMFTVDEMFGGWEKAHLAHFAEGAMFDRIYLGGK